MELTMLIKCVPGLFRCLQTATLCLFSVFLASSCIAGTLFERSQKMMTALEQKASANDFTFVVLGDSRDNDMVFKKSLELAASCKPLFILHDGDFSRSGSPQEVDHFLETIRGTVPDIPFFVVMGNHEQRQPFQEKIGPLNYVIDSASLGFKVIVVDNSDYVLKPAQLEYLQNQLDGKRKNTFAAMHIPPKTKRWTWHVFSEGAPELIRLLSGKKVTAAFYGHLHLYDRDELEGVPHIISGGCGAPLVSFGFPGDPVYHIVVVKVKDGVASYRMVKIKE
jgi:3',5'-cyclic-AMP phosphodiesterase